MLSIITAVAVDEDENNLIGNGNNLPWFVAEDLRYFKKTTMNHHVVMGRKTYESVGYLPIRQNTILTNNPTNVNTKNGSMIVTSTFDNFIDRYNKSVYHEEVFIIGGREIYKLFLPFIDKLYVTHIKGKFTGDVYFPEYDLTKTDLSCYGFKCISVKKSEKCNFLIHEKI